MKQKHCLYSFAGAWREKKILVLCARSVFAAYCVEQYSGGDPPTGTGAYRDVLK